jgi:hypothetical protein
MLKTAVHSTDITPLESVPMMGYGDRTHNSEGVHDPLYAFVWYLEDPKNGPFVWIMLDLCLLSVPSSRVLRGELAGKTDLPPESIVITATHTHSGPDTRYLHTDSEPWAKNYYNLLIDRLSALVIETREKAVDGYITVSSGESRLAVNRRHVDQPIDPRIIVFTIFDRDDVKRGVVFHYSCHLTTQGVENYLISADWAGIVRNILQKEHDIPIMYLQGAEGNVDPYCRGPLDMADPDQALGSSFDVMEEISVEMAASVNSAMTGKTLERIDSLSYKHFEMSLPLRYGALNPEETQQKIEDWKERLSGFLGIPVKEVPETMIINGMIKDRCRETECSPDETRSWVSEQFAYCAFVSVYKLGGELIDQAKGLIQSPLTLLKMGKVVLLGIPMEVLLDVAFDWQKRHPDSIALIAGLYNGWTGYLPHKKNFDEPDAGELYETVSTVFSEDAAGVLLNEAEKQAAAL